LCFPVFPFLICRISRLSNHSFVALGFPHFLVLDLPNPGFLALDFLNLGFVFLRSLDRDLLNLGFVPPRFPVPGLADWHFSNHGFVFPGFTLVQCVAIWRSQIAQETGFAGLISPFCKNYKNNNCRNTRNKDHASGYGKRQNRKIALQVFSF